MEKEIDTQIVIKKDDKLSISDSVWLFTSRIAQQFFSLVQITILARLLDPTAFGLIGLANLATTAIGVFVYMGFEYALIQKPNLQDIDVHTAWWATLGRYLIISMGLVLLAKPISILYKTPEAIPILLAFAVIEPLQGLVSMSPVFFRRSLQYFKIFFLEAGSSFVGLIFGVISAFIFRNVWALVIAYLVSTLTLLITSYALHPYRPKMMFDRKCFVELTNYGQWILGSGILLFISSQGTTAFSGWMFGIAGLGLYQMASRFALLPTTQLSEVIQAALMPAYSIIQSDKERVTRAFLKSLSLTSVLIFGLSSLFAIGLPKLLILIIGYQWQEAVILIPSIAALGGIQAIIRTGFPLYLGTGYPRFQFFIDLTQAVIMILLFYPIGILFGLRGLPYAAIIGSLCAAPIWWIGIKKSTNCSFRDVLLILLPASLGVVVMIIVYLLGSIPNIDMYGHIYALIWHILLLIIVSSMFIVIILIGQRYLPFYSPLQELWNLLQNWWKQKAGVLKSRT